MDNNVNNQVSNDLENSANNIDVNINKAEPLVEQPVSQPSVSSTLQPGQNAVTDKVVVENISDNHVTKDDTSIQNIVDNSPVEVPVESVKVKEEVTYKDPSKLSTVLVILLFVGLFIFIFEMPKINEWLENRKQDAEVDEIERQAKQIEEAQKKKQEEEKKAEEEAIKKQEEEENLTLTLRCKISIPATETITYSKNITETFDYNKTTNKVSSSTQTTKYIFTEQNDSYTSLKTKCETDASNNLGKEGYSVSCTSDDLSVTIGSGFDLANYKPITDGVTTIEANAKLDENISDVKTRLVAQGYICE